MCRNEGVCWMAQKNCDDLRIQLCHLCGHLIVHRRRTTMAGRAATYKLCDLATCHSVQHPFQLDLVAVISMYGIRKTSRS
jgi:hypothetical protein